MKSRRFKNEWERKSHEEFVLFYYICGKRDRAFIDAPKKKRKREDYVRLLHISLTLGFRKMAMRIIANVENQAEFQRFLNELPQDGTTITKWIDDFVREIPDPRFRNVAIESWNEMRKNVKEDDFDIKSLLL